MAISMKPIKRKRIAFWIRGTSPLIQHKWSEKALRMMREKGEGKKTRNRDPRDPEGEMIASTYHTDDGEYGVPILAIKSAMIAAAHKDIGIEKTLVRKALFFPCDDSGKIVPMDCSDPVMREDAVRVGAGSADLRYRPEFARWAVRLEAEIDAELLTPEDVANLIDRAGFGVGIGEMRPERGGEYGRFEIDRSKPMEEIL